MTLPNKLTLSRILVIPVFLLAMLIGGPHPQHPFIAGWWRLFALVLMVAAAITDYYDGKIARQMGKTSNFGKLFDPIADKVLVAAAFIGFVELKMLPAWPVILILAREFLVTGLRGLAAASGTVMPADRWGKHKMGWQLGSIITGLTFITAREFLRGAHLWEKCNVGSWTGDQILMALFYFPTVVAVVLTVYSGAHYLKNNWSLVRESA